MMNREEAIEMWVIPALKNTWNEKKCDEILKALDQEPCDDAISRQAVLNYIRDNYRRWFINDDAFIQCVNGIKDIVPVTSQQKMGRWKPYDGSWYECSECGAVREAVGFFENYCPNCGRKMEVDDE